MRVNLPDRNFFIGKPIPTRPDVDVREWIASGNNAHIYRGYSESLQRDLACKIIPRANLLYGPDGRELWREEVQKADILRNTTVVKFLDIQQWKDDAAKVDCVVLLSEFVDGPSLRSFVKQNPDSIDVYFIVHWLETMLNLFHEMKLRSIEHGDIHTGNILVEDRSSYNLLPPRYVFRVTDFGVADATSDSRFKDDYLQLAHILAARGESRAGGRWFLVERDRHYE